MQTSGRQQSRKTPVVHGVDLELTGIMQCGIRPGAAMQMHLELDDCLCAGGGLGCRDPGEATQPQEPALLIDQCRGEAAWLRTRLSPAIMSLFWTG